MEKTIFLILASAALAIAAPVGRDDICDSHLDFRHHNYEEMKAYMIKIRNACPDITRLYALNQRTVENRQLLILEMTDKPGQHEIGNFSFMLFFAFLILLEYR